VSATQHVTGGLVAAVSATLSARPDAIVLHGDATLAGRDILESVERYAAALAALGVGAGDRIVVQAEKSIAQALLYLAVLRVGAVFVPLNPAYSIAETEYFIRDAEPVIVVCDPRRADDLAPLASEVRGRLLTLGGSGHGTLADAVAGRHGPAPPLALTDSDLAVIIYTSGTTGRSKGAMLTHGNLLANARALIETWRIGPADVLLHALPLFHIHGLFVAFNTLLLAGGRIRWLRAFEPEAVIRELPASTIFMGVPTYYTRLLAAEGFSRPVTTAVRVFVCGSAPLLPQTFREFEAVTGQRIVERYGMSECGIICSNPIDGPRRPGAVGRPLPGVELRIVDERGQAVAPGVAGGIEVRGPHVCHGYWRRPQSRASDFRPDGYFITGDIGEFDADGYVHVVGRAKDLIISGGLNIYPREIELVLDTLPNIEESAVIGVPHPDFGEAVVAVVQLREGVRDFRVADLLAAARSRLAGFKLPKAVYVLDELPRNSMGKLQKAELRERYAGAFTAP